MAKSDFENALTKEELNMFFLLDTSGSMCGERIDQLNFAMSEALNALRDAAVKEEIQLNIRAIEFNNDAQWIVGDEEEGVDISDVIDNQWHDLTYKSAGTNTAAAILLARGAMHTKYLGTRNYHPIVILITDGDSNDFNDTKNATRELKSSLRSASNPSKEKVQCIAIGVVDANQQELEDFASTGNIGHSDGTVDEDVPLVFNVDDVNELTSLLKGIAVSSIASTVAGGIDDDDNKLTIETDSEDDDDWEE